MEMKTIRAIDKLTELDREVYRAGKDIFNQMVTRERLDEESTVRLHSTPSATLRKAA